MQNNEEVDITEESKKMIKPYEEGFYSSVPTKLTVFFRTFFLWQLVRFVYINVKMVLMIAKSHQSEFKK